MRSEISDPAGSAPKRFDDPLTKFWRHLSGRVSGPRPLIALTALALLVGVAFLTVWESSNAAPEISWLDGGRSFSADDAHTISETLAAKGISGVVHDRGKIGVPSAHRSAAAELLKELKIGRSPKDLLNDPLKPSIFDGPDEIEHVRMRRREQPIEAALERLPGIASATVRLSERKRSRFGLVEGLQATVFITPEEGWTGNSNSIEAIQNIVWGHANTTRLRRDQDISIFDNQGTAYLDAGDPSFALRTRADERAHQWESILTSRLGRVIEGVRVSVRMDWVPTPVVAPVPVNVESARPTTATVTPNTPLRLPPEASELEDRSSAGSTALIGKADVLVEVPARHYLQRFRIGNADRHPTQDELNVYVSEAEKFIEATIEHVIPVQSLGTWRLLRVPMSEIRPAAAAPPPKPYWREREWWILAVVLGAVVVLVLATASGHRLATRRPATRLARETHTNRFERDARSGPADQVRELVRRDPVAAAGVLQRWVGQGGNAP